MFFLYNNPRGKSTTRKTYALYPYC